MEALAIRLEAIAIGLAAIAIRLEAIAIGLEAIAIRLEAIAIRLEAISIRFGAIAIRLEAIAIRLERPSLVAIKARTSWSTGLLGGGGASPWKEVPAMEDETRLPPAAARRSCRPVDCGEIQVVRCQNGPRCW